MSVVTDFTPHPLLAYSAAEFDPAVHVGTYRHNYPAIFRDIASGRLDHKTTFRSLAQKDRFFIVYFIIDIAFYFKFNTFIWS